MISASILDFDWLKKLGFKSVNQIQSIQIKANSTEENDSWINIQTFGSFGSWAKTLENIR